MKILPFKFQGSYARLLLGVMVGSVTHVAAFGSQDWTRYLDKEIFKRIEVTGYRKLGLRFNSVSGDREAYRDLTYFGQGDRTFTDIGQIRMTGRNVLGGFNFQFVVDDNHFNNPHQRRWSIDYARGAWSSNIGDIQGSLLNTNRLVSFSKSLRGVQLGYKSKGFEAKMLRSESKGSARTISIPGSNSAGPYYLQTSQIIPDSEQVQVDGVRMQRGSDYVISYEVGTITFVNRVISPASTIVVTFEALAFNSDPGLIEGIGLAYDFGKAGKIGLTALRQTVRGGGSLSSRIDRFAGYGPPTTPYFLQFEPLRSLPITVKVDGIIQREGVDYRFDPNIVSVFYFTRHMPPERNIDVAYTPKPRETANGNRELIGIDYRIPLGGGVGNELTLYQAVGKLKSPVTPLSGTARGVDLRYRNKKFDFNASWRNIPDTFVGIETRGFNRNERAYEFNLTMNPGKPFTYGASYSNSSISNRSIDPRGNLFFIPSRFTIARGFLQYSPEGKGKQPWRLEHRRTASQFNNLETRIDSTELATTQRLGPLDLRMGFQRQSATGPVVGATGSAVRSSRSIVDSINLSTGYSKGDLWGISAQVNYSRLNVDGRHGSGKDYSLQGNYKPRKDLRFNASYSMSDSGALSALSRYSSGFGYGYGGSDSSVSTLGASRTRQWTLSTFYEPNDWMTLIGRYFQTSSSGGFSSNSTATSYGLTGAFKLGKKHVANLSWSQNQTRFVDSPVSSRSTIIDAFFQGGLNSRLSYRVGASILQSGGNSTFAQDSKSYEASLSYLLDKRQSLIFSYVGASTRGYQPQDTMNLAFIYQYQIWQNMTLNVGYRVRQVRNQDPSVLRGAYRASGLDIELGFNFGL